MTHTIITSPWLDTEQAAAWLHVSPHTLRNYRALGTGPTYSKAGARVLYSYDALMDYVRVVTRPASV